MGKMKELLPEFAAEVTSSLYAMGRSDLAERLPGLELERWTHDSDSGAANLYFSGERPLNVVEQNVVGVRRDGTIELQDMSGTVLIDTDNFNRVEAIEVLRRKDVSGSAYDTLSSPGSDPDSTRRVPTGSNQ